MKFILVFLLLGVAVSLFSGLYFLIKDPSDSRRVVKSLTWRVALSLLALVVLFAAIQTGLIVPHEVGAK